LTYTVFGMLVLPPDSHPKKRDFRKTMLNFAAASEILLCAGASVSTFYLSWQQSRVDKWLTILPKDDDGDARRLQALYGYNEHSFLGVSVQRHVWTDPSLDGVVSYTERGDIWVVAGEPLG